MRIRKLVLAALVLCTGTAMAYEEMSPPPGIKDRLLIIPANGARPAQPWHNIAIYTTPTNMSAADSVALQASVPGRLMLWTGSTKQQGFGEFNRFVDLAAARGRFEYVYVYDELFWTGSADNIGQDEDEVLAAARYAKSKSMKTAVVILPNTILNPAFKLKDSNAFDVIAIDVYPSIIVSPNTDGCRVNDNLYTNLLVCSQRKLRNMGFRGQVWYLYQGFGIEGENAGVLEQNLLEQKETIRDAAKFGISGISPFGLHLGPEELQAEPWLQQGSTHPLKPLMSFTPWPRIEGNARRYSMRSSPYPAAQYGTLNVKVGGAFDGSFTDKWCVYEGQRYQFDGVASCRYSDGQWYALSTSGVTLKTETVELAGTVDASGKLAGTWRNPAGTKTGVITGAPIVGGIGGRFAANGKTIRNFTAK